jgi:hypothetical protein
LRASGGAVERSREMLALTAKAILPVSGTRSRKIARRCGTVYARCIVLGALARPLEARCIRVRAYHARPCRCRMGVRLGLANRLSDPIFGANNVSRPSGVTDKTASRTTGAQGSGIAGAAVGHNVRTSAHDGAYTRWITTFTAPTAVPRPTTPGGKMPL